MIVDDDTDLLAMLGPQLEQWGYQALLADSGEDALAQAKAARPDLVLLDIMMPKMKGREVCAALKADPATAKIPVIFMTALGLADHVRAGLELGAEDYLVKPFRLDELRERIQVCLLRHGHPDLTAAGPEQGDACR